MLVSSGLSFSASIQKLYSVDAKINLWHNESGKIVNKLFRRTQWRNVYVVTHSGANGCCPMPHFNLINAFYYSQMHSAKAEICSLCRISSFVRHHKLKSKTFPFFFFHFAANKKMFLLRIFYRCCAETVLSSIVLKSFVWIIFCSSLCDPVVSRSALHLGIYSPEVVCVCVHTATSAVIIIIIISIVCRQHHRGCLCLAY